MVRSRCDLFREQFERHERALLVDLTNRGCSCDSRDTCSLFESVEKEKMIKDDIEMILAGSILDHWSYPLQAADDNFARCLVLECVESAHSLCSGMHRQREVTTPQGR